MDVALSDYARALDALYARTTGQWRLGLERVSAMLSELGDPHLRLPVFHVAGTNGKGSTCATLEALLTERGHTVAKYTSPHLIEFRERFVVGGAAVSEERVHAFLRRHSAMIERVGATFFEATTAMGFALFAESDATCAVIEVGLGGRLDATNVVDPVVAGVTAVGLDHVEYLGATVSAIADEKAGIFKRGRPAVVGERDEMLRVRLATRASEAGAEPIVLVAERSPVRDVVVDAAGTHFTLGRTSAPELRLRTPLGGAYQAENAAVAIAMTAAAGPDFSLGDEQLQAGLDRVRLAGRFQRAGKVILDVAHNPDGAAVLAQTLDAVNAARPRVALLTVLADKDWRGMMRALAPSVDEFVITCAPTAPAARAWTPADAHAFALEQGWHAVLEEDFDRALARATSDGATVVVTGSFHTVGDAMPRLQLNSLGN